MTSIMSNTVSAIGASLPVSIVAKATAVAAITLLTGRFASKSSASVRHLLFTAAFTMFLVLPVAAVLAPAVNVPISARALHQAAAFPRRIEAVSPNLRRAVSAAASETVRSVRSRVDISELLMLSWLAGLLISVLPVAAGLWGLRKASESGTPWPRGRQVLDPLAARSGVDRAVSVLLHESVRGPMTFGVIRPTILFPFDAETWTDDDLRRAMVHELEHVRRGDWIIHCLARSICSLYWFHPLVWMSWRRLTLEAERACDDAVLQYGEPAGYAEQLVMLARKLSHPSTRPVLAMADRRDLRARVRALLDMRQQRGKTALRYVAAAIGAAVLMAAAISPLRTVAVPQSSSGAKEAKERDVALERSRDLLADPQKEEESKTGPSWLDSIEAEGYHNLSVDDVIRLKGIGVDAAYIRGLRAAGFELSMDDLIRSYGIGITPEFVQAIKATGIRDVTPDNLIRLKGIGIDAGRIREIRSLGFPNLSVDDAVRLQGIGITPEYIKKAQQRFKDITVDDLVRLKGSGIL
jgi:beta-lactamase regulating signal transducer with metallopeptidase domain